MSALDEARQRFQRRAQERPTLALSPKQDQRLADALDRSIGSDWYRVRQTDGTWHDVFFWPPRTLVQARDWPAYRGMDVEIA
ncbi:MAG: hypothetical protein IT518_25070 [Burkholderiales bacterium]|nr:hypothetical protein [Burkholderiales bacterium]